MSLFTAQIIHNVCQGTWQDWYLEYEHDMFNLSPNEQLLDISTESGLLDFPHTGIVAEWKKDNDSTHPYFVKINEMKYRLNENDMKRFQRFLFLLSENEKPMTIEKAIHRLSDSVQLLGDNVVRIPVTTLFDKPVTIVGCVGFEEEETDKIILSGKIHIDDCEMPLPIYGEYDKRGFWSIYLEKGF